MGGRGVLDGDEQALRPEGAAPLLLEVEVLAVDLPPQRHHGDPVPERGLR